MSKVSEFKARMEIQYGKEWLSNPIFREQYNVLLEEEKLLSQDEIIEKVENLKIFVEESFAEDKNEEVRAKFLEGLETLRLKIIKGRAERRQLNEKHFTVLEKLEKVADSWNTDREKIFSLIEALGEAIKDARKMQDEAREAIEMYNTEAKIIRDETLKYNKFTIELNKKYLKLDKRIERYNRLIKRLPRGA